MPFLHIFILSAIQGITEFLPISSSGHLQILPTLTNLDKQPLIIDISVHLGTLGGVIIFFYRDIIQLLQSFPQLIKGRKSSDSNTLIMLITATIPITIIGGIIWVTDNVYLFRDIEIIAWATLGFGLLLYISDRFFLTVRNIESMNFFQATIFGLAQVIAIIPGASRSGMVITLARLFGFKRFDAAKFAMLLSIPAILLPGIVSIFELIESKNLQLQYDFFISFFISFIFSLLAIFILMKWIKNSSFAPFAFYRIVIGGMLLIWIYYFDAEKLFII